MLYAEMQVDSEIPLSSTATNNSKEIQSHQPIKLNTNNVHHGSPNNTVKVRMNGSLFIH
jgi:hypothetical protein